MPENSESYRFFCCPRIRLCYCTLLLECGMKLNYWSRTKSNINTLLKHSTSSNREKKWNQTQHAQFHPWAQCPYRPVTHYWICCVPLCLPHVSCLHNHNAILNTSSITYASAYEYSTRSSESNLVRRGDATLRREECQRAQTDREVQSQQRKWESARERVSESQRISQQGVSS